jgi:hypothetical protein
VRLLRRLAAPGAAAVTLTVGITVLGYTNLLLGCGLVVAAAVLFAVWLIAELRGRHTPQRREVTTQEGNVRTTEWEETRRGVDATVTPDPVAVTVNVPHATAKSEAPNPEHAVSVIRQWSTEHTTADIVYLAVERRPLAKQIAEMFTLAGWVRLSFADNPQTAVPYFTGVRVQGYNEVLVRAIAEGLTSAGIDAVREEVNTPTMEPDDPNYPFALQTVWITVGHAPSTSPTS